MRGEDPERNTIPMLVSVANTALTRQPPSSLAAMGAQAGKQPGDPSVGPEGTKATEQVHGNMSRKSVLLMSPSDDDSESIDDE